MSATIRLTMAQALVRYLSVLRTEEGEPVFGGRPIFQEPSRRWLAGELDDTGLIAAVRANFEQLISLWQRTRNRLERAA
ncbi:2-deoxy-5-keto-D-gluconate 6-phosphate aldolase domain-containing protein [Janthinobacterium sp. GW456P]|uniref:2-deoxy-5-keto-D-gluconate 6-phosphate aldolase domain-containing protein n=1 Tax=Janthinobacterium sp. GW456P TaxID=1981506 RepID=UPI000A3484FD|nr:DUF2090 domain-containing protein [Janthinobacterium sp. GW456P]